MSSADRLRFFPVRVKPSPPSKRESANHLLRRFRLPALIPIRRKYQELVVCIGSLPAAQLLSLLLLATAASRSLLSTLDSASVGSASADASRLPLFEAHSCPRFCYPSARRHRVERSAPAHPSPTSCSSPKSRPIQLAADAEMGPRASVARW